MYDLQSKASGNMTILASGSLFAALIPGLRLMLSLRIEMP